MGLMTDVLMYIKYCIGVCTLCVYLDIVGVGLLVQVEAVTVASYCYTTFHTNSK